MKISKIITLAILFFWFCVHPATAHFGMVIPSDNMVMADDERSIDITLSFSHPFEMIGMDFEKPEKLLLVKNGKTFDLNKTLEPVKILDHSAFKLKYSIKRPGAHVFAMTPRPYWEPSEDCYIIHYTKTVVAAFGDDEGWDAELGLETEIVPLSKPFGLYAGNVFQGIVKLKGKAVPYAEVEVEYYNQEKKVQAPTDYMITQTLKADGNGVFSYAAPVAGWWGFAALSESDQTMDYQSMPKGVELGAVIWVKFETWQEK